MDTPRKTTSTTANKATNIPVGLKSKSKHTTNPTEQGVGYGGGKVGVAALDGAQGNCSTKYC
jgi:hypothetical protein